jgi:hypothetical protein
LEAGSAFRVPTFRNYTLVNPQVGSPWDLGVRHPTYQKDVTKAFKKYLDNFMKIFLDGFTIV